MCLSLTRDDRLWNVVFDTLLNNYGDIIHLGFHRYFETMFLSYVSKIMFWLVHLF
jgi:hypothetical protein